MVGAGLPGKALGGVRVAVRIGDVGLDIVDGVPSIRSAPRTMSTGPTSGRCSMASSFTLESPRGFGRKGERVANTPTRVLPPRRGGRTVGDQLSRTAPENCHTSQI